MLSISHSIVHAKGAVRQSGTQLASYMHPTAIVCSHDTPNHGNPAQTYGLTLCDFANMRHSYHANGNTVQSLRDNLIKLQAEIDNACQSCGRDNGQVTLIGAAKTQSAQVVRDAYDAGVRHIGENYLQEASEKVPLLADLPITWHFIGAIQSNKTRQIAELFDWVHTVERAKVARRLSSQCPAGKRLNVLLQVNVDRDPAKSGVPVDQVPALLNEVRTLPNLAVRGLMTILSNDSDPGVSYQTVAQLFAELDTSANPVWDTLSMGMTADMTAAIAAGATHIRIGTALFGARK